MAWAEWEHYLISGDCSRFEKALPALEGIYNFIEKNRKRESKVQRLPNRIVTTMGQQPRYSKLPIS